MLSHKVLLCVFVCQNEDWKMNEILLSNAAWTMWLCCEAKPHEIVIFARGVWWSSVSVLLQLRSLCCECVKAQRSSLNYSQNCHVGVQSATVRASQPPSERVRLDSRTVGLIQHQPAACSGSCRPGWCQVRRRELTRARWPELAEHQGRRSSYQQEEGRSQAVLVKHAHFKIVIILDILSILVQMLVLSLKTTTHDYWNVFIDMSESQLKSTRTFIIRVWGVGQTACLHLCAAVLQVLYVPSLQGFIFRYAVWAGPWLRPTAVGGG